MNYFMGLSQTVCTDQVMLEFSDGHSDATSFLFSCNIFMYNGNIIKKREVLPTLLSATSTVKMVVVKKIVTFENHPFACDGAGWFSCFLIHFSERNMHYLHAQSPSEPLLEIQEMFP